MRKKKERMLRGFARVQLIDPDGSVAEERTMENQFCDLFRNNLLTTIANNTAFTSETTAIAVGTGGAVTGSMTSLVGELGTLVNADTAVAGSSRLRLTGSFASDANTGNISNMGVHQHSSGGSLVCGNTFSASFAKASNQTLSVTYDITFSS